MAVRTAALRLDRSHLQLIPCEGADSLIAELDATLERPVTPPHQTPVVVQRLDEWEDWAATGVTEFRYVTAHGQPVTANLPTALLAPDVRRVLYELVRALEEASRNYASRVAQCSCLWPASLARRIGSSPNASHAARTPRTTASFSMLVMSGTFQPASHVPTVAFVTPIAAATSVCVTTRASRTPSSSRALSTR